MRGTKLHVLSHNCSSTTYMVVYIMPRRPTPFDMGKSMNTIPGLPRPFKNLHGYARLKKQIENAHKLGLSVSYDLVMDVKRAIARAVCKCHADDGVITVVLPTNLRCNVFTTYDVDNLDSHNKGRVSWHCFECTNPSVKGKSRRAANCYSSELL